jgi:hypothetical protein
MKSALRTRRLKGGALSEIFHQHDITFAAIELIEHERAAIRSNIIRGQATEE